MRILFLLLLNVLFISTLNAQTTYVPDDNFEQRLIDLGHDDVLDDHVLTANISGLTSLNITNQSITDATGLEDFASLTSFQCAENQIAILNFHPNANLDFFICQNNLLSELDLSQHTSLFEFGCTNTNITSLDLSQNANLRYLYCSSTPLTILDVSNNSNLLEISAANSNFEFVDLRNGNNEEINDINFINNPNLPYIYVDDCNYSSANWKNIDPSTIFIELEGQTECEPLTIRDIVFDLNITLYPNPANDILRIQSIIPIEKVKIYTTQGILIGEYFSNELDVSQLSVGLYFVKIFADGKMVSKKIMKN